nr:unnamed protein product [Callosobruchus chinensis]
MILFIGFNYLVFAFLSVLLIWYVDRWKRRRLFPCSETVPGPYALPIIGAAYHLFGKPSDVALVVLKLIDSYPSTFKFWMGYKLLYFVKKPQHLQKIINNPRALDKDYFYEQFALVLGDGLITSGGVKWKRHRKLINPSFNLRALNNFVGLFNETAERATMGVVINVESIEKSIGEVLEKLNDLFSEKSLKLWNHVEAIWYLSGKKAIFQNYIKRLRSIVDEVNCFSVYKATSRMNKLMLTVLQNLQLWKMFSTFKISGFTPKRRAFLEMLIADTDLNEKELRDEVNTFLVAATRTTSNTLTSVFAVLGIYPDVQEKVYQEVMEVIGTDEEILPEHINKMEFTDRVIRETMRLFPAGPIITRYISGDIDLGNIFISIFKYIRRYIQLSTRAAPEPIFLKPGASVAIPILYIHRCAKFWDNPLQFDPDRYLTENVGDRHPLTYLGFSQGLRSCIGSTYAMMIMKVAIALAVRRIKFFSEYKSVEDIDLKMGILLRMKDGPKVWIERR